MRHFMMKKVLYPLTLLFLAISCCVFAKFDIPSPQIQLCLDAARETHHLPGVQVSIKEMETGKLWNFSSGYKDTHTLEPLKTDHLMQIGSITKSFTASLALLLEADSEAGRLGVEFNIEQTIGQWLPEYPEWKSIKIRQLLNMTSGIYNYTDNNTFYQEMLKEPQRIWLDHELASLAYSQTPNTLFTVGAKFNYSNTNYILVGMILEKVSGQQLETLINERILKKYPNQFKCTSFSPKTYPNDEMQKMARGYSMNINIHPELYQQDITEISLSWAGAAGAITSTSSDVANWVELLFSNNFLPTKQRDELECLISVDNSGEEVSIIPKDSNLSGYGLGVGRLYDPDHGYTWSHTGGTLGFHTLFIYLPQKSMVITVIINQIGPEIDGDEDVIFIANEILKACIFKREL